MTVYVDSARNGFGRMLMCHMVADHPEELHTMARAIGMQRGWYQSPDRASFPHYDVSLSRRKIAVIKGAREISRQELAAHMRKIKDDLIAKKLTWQAAGWL